MTAWIRTMDMDMVPSKVKTGAAHVEFLELLREMGQKCFADNDLFGTYCSTVEMLGEDCRYSRQIAKRLIEEDRNMQACLKAIKEQMEWMILP